MNLQIYNLKIEFTKGFSLFIKNLTIHSNQVFGIVGESGSGKSLTALAIMGLLPKAVQLAQGQIMFKINNDEYNLLEVSKKRNIIRGSKISMIFQDALTSLNPSMKCGKQVDEVSKIHLGYNSKKAKEWTLEQFKLVKLPDIDIVYNKYPHELSGGQKQRVMIAMAIATRPNLLIADEPTTALDVTIQKEIIDLLKELKSKLGMSILFISHDLGVVSKICDNIAIMKNGQIIEYGTKYEILNHPTAEYTQRLINCKPNLQTDYYRLPTITENHIERNERKDELRDTEKEIILSVNKIEKKYNKRGHRIKALDNVTFDLYKGETLGLVGESGSGKTTIGRALMKLIDINNGNIKAFSKDLTKITKSDLKNYRKKVQIIFQDPYSTLNPKMTIGQIIREPLIAHSNKSDEPIYEKVIQMLENIKLGKDYFDRYPHELSGGQRQRVGIARSLIINPEIVICDESVSALDVSVQADILNLLNDLKEKQGLTYIFISHDMAVVKYMSDRIIVLNQGKIEDCGTTDSIYSKPESEYTQRLISSIPEINS